jgi:predicted ATPase/DNA-binding CsgD family transcriptional regulator
MSAGHGGQVLLSQTTRDIVEHDLPEGVSLQDLGAHRLKDLQRPSHLYQLVIAGLPADFPPLGTLDTHPHNLPVQPTPFLGREQVVATVQHLLHREDIRLLTLTGPGGIGKTRLGLQVAADEAFRFADGVYFVNLAPLSDPALVLPTIASTLDLKESAGQALLDVLRAYVRNKELLLLLDNFEQVLSAAVPVADLLAACLKLKVLVTSRAVLHVRGEQEFAVPPLALPDPKHLPHLVALSQYEAVALFITRAQAVKPAFQVTSANALAIAEICVRLNGLPLAIELAAARIKLLPPQALLGRLGQRLTVLTGGARDVPARQQTLRNTIAWSYNLLDATEQRLFRWLSVFVGGCTLEAVEAVCAFLDLSTDVVWVLERVASLIDKSLFQQTEQEDGEPRFVMLETIREYGLEALAASGEMEATWQAHATYHLRLSEEAKPGLEGPQQALWLERLEREHDNLRAAMQWSLEQAEGEHGMEMALHLGRALERFWILHGYYKEGRAFLEQALVGSEGVVTLVRAQALSAAARLILGQGDLDEVEVLCEESLALCREIGDAPGIAYSLYLLGAVASARGNPAAAHSLLEQSVGLEREIGDQGRIVLPLCKLAARVVQQGEYTRGRALLEESLALAREAGDKRGIAHSLEGLANLLFVTQGDQARIRSLLEEVLALSREIGYKDALATYFSLSGEVVLSQGDVATAYSLLEECLRLCREMGDRVSIAQSLSLMAKVVTIQGDHTAARALYEESLALAREIGNKNIAFCLEGLAGVVAAQGELAWAVQLWGAAKALREAIGVPIPPVYHAEYEQLVATARTQLGEKAFATAWAQGRMMTPEQALTVQEPATMPIPVPTEQPPAPPAKPSPTYPDGLTTREVEVLRLVAQGMTNEQMAKQLVISPRTVNTHLTSIFSKIGVSTRSAATRYTIDHHLV